MEKQRDYKKERETRIANREKKDSLEKERIRKEQEVVEEEKLRKIKGLSEKINQMDFDGNGNLVQ